MIMLNTNKSTLITLKTENVTVFNCLCMFYAWYNLFHDGE